MSTTADKLAQLEKRLALAAEPAGEAGIIKRAKKGIPSARERIGMLLDPGSFVEIGALVRQPGDPNALYSDGVVTGHGTVEGRPVAVFSHDQTVLGGTVGEMFGRKVENIVNLAGRVGCPMVGIYDSGGARIQDAVTSLSWYARMSVAHKQLLGKVPQVSVIVGKCAGGSVYAPTVATDTIVATEDSYMFVTGPDVIRAVTGEDVSIDELGGAFSQTENGNIQHLAKDEAEAYAWARSYLTFLPSSCHEVAPIVNPGLEPEIVASDRELDAIIPDSDTASYDMHEILLRIFDDGDFLEYNGQYARNLITGFARVDGRTVGVVANQPLVLAGALDARGSDKAARFIRICDAFQVPLVFVVDTPGVLPGVEEERIGVIRRGGRFFFSVAEASVPMVTLNVRKAYGGAYAAMGSKQFGADINLAWPTARIAVMGPQSAIAVIGRRQIEAAGERGEEVRQQLVDYYYDHVATPWTAAERGYVDAVIQPHESRLQIRQALRLLRDKQATDLGRKHMLMPI
ncbi:acyl-CoA carboxylase subunit beta [Skermania piniformis]|uniref:Acyl-CoA carboxylase subunit beta n=1 Tax=Skermania pinensis TaxID=39122 RepID=A0ABX8S880_9ACTN|nr:acyl-CoA carboxylase subunit beta [Skermania piniformis]QXQ14063.1 acyl-CoA carboxylase subunit beta [Skermania piniformis]